MQWKTKRNEMFLARSFLFEWVKWKKKKRNYCWFIFTFFLRFNCTIVITILSPFLPWICHLDSPSSALSFLVFIFNSNFIIVVSDINLSSRYDDINSVNNVKLLHFLYSFCYKRNCYYCNKLVCLLRLSSVWRICFVLFFFFFAMYICKRLSFNQWHMSPIRILL